MENFLYIAGNVYNLRHLVYFYLDNETNTDCSNIIFKFVDDKEIVCDFERRMGIGEFEDIIEIIIGGRDINRFNDYWADYTKNIPTDHMGLDEQIKYLQNIKSSVNKSLEKNKKAK